MTPVSRILDSLAQGERQRATELLPLVYRELRQLAAAKVSQEKPGQTLQATALVHEAYLRLVDGDAATRWENRKHFFSAAAEAMRRILLENARRKKRLKHGGGQQMGELKEDLLSVEMPDDDLIAVHEALDTLAESAPEVTELVKLRYFAGLTFKESADVLGISERTAKRHWAYARGWLLRHLSRGKSKE